METMRARAQRRAAGVLCASLAMTPAMLLAQPGAFSEAHGAVDFGVVYEQFHRELEPNAYQDTRWNIASVVLTYGVTDRIAIGVQGGLSDFVSDDFPGSQYTRYAVGIMGAAEILRRGPWALGISGRYLDTFDFDYSAQSFHKRVRSWSASVQGSRRFDIFHAPAAVDFGAIYVDDLVQTFPWGAESAVASTSNGAPGAILTGRVRVVPAFTVFGYVNYVEQVQGGFGIALHAGNGGL